MQLQEIVMNREDARTKLEEYETEMATKRWRLSNVWKKDWQDVSRIYRAIAGGGHFIDVTRAIEEGETKIIGKYRANFQDGSSHDLTLVAPSLAVMWSNRRECYLNCDWGNELRFFDSRPRLGGAKSTEPVFSVKGPAKVWLRNEVYKSIVPSIPPKHYPSSGKPANWVTLWEAEWYVSAPVAPVDPALLEPLAGLGFCRVLAQWDLTEVERIALQARV